MKFVLLRSLLTLAALSSAVFPMVCQTSVLTRSYDNGRTGWNSTEWKLTPQAVQTRGLQSISLVPGNDDPCIEAQPLYIPGITMPDGKKHDVIYICTMSNNIWAFDANTGAKIWEQPISQTLRRHSIAERVAQRTGPSVQANCFLSTSPASPSSG